MRPLSSTYRALPVPYEVLIHRGADAELRLGEVGRDETDPDLVEVVVEHVRDVAVEPELLVDAIAGAERDALGQAQADLGLAGDDGRILQALGGEVLREEVVV